MVKAERRIRPVLLLNRDVFCLLLLSLKRVTYLAGCNVAFIILVLRIDQIHRRVAGIKGLISGVFQNTLLFVDGKSGGRGEKAA